MKVVVMRKLLASLRRLLQRKEKPRWASIGSSTYQKAIRGLASGYPERIRRKAWGDDRYLYIKDPNKHIYGDMTDGCWPDAEFYTPRGPVRHVTKTARWGKEFWQWPDEDINADDWQMWDIGGWRGVTSPAPRGP